MPDTIIENPILNSPFREPDRHWRFTDEGITNEIVEPAAPVPTSCRSRRPRRRASNSSLTRSGPRTASSPTTTSTASGNGSSCGAKGIRRRHPGHSQALAALDRPRPREQALLLPDRSPGDAHLPDRSRREGRRRLDRKPGSGRPTQHRTRGSIASRSRWRPARARRSSWPCSSPGTR